MATRRSSQRERRSMRFLFGDCVFEPRARRLSRAGAVVHVTPKALQLLEHLLKHRPGVVSQRDLRDLLWPGTFVGYSSIGHVVAELRKAIGDEDHRRVRTSYGAGYALDGEVVAEADTGLPPTNEATPFCLRWGTLEIPLHAGENVLGRSPECSCRIASSRVSRRHARIVVSGRSALIDDLGSKNGTHVGGRRVDGPTSLADGDVILLGQEAVLFSAATSASTTESAGP